MSVQETSALDASGHTFAAIRIGLAHPTRPRPFNAFTCPCAMRRQPHHVMPCRPSRAFVHPRRALHLVIPRHVRAFVVPCHASPVPCALVIAPSSWTRLVRMALPQPRSSLSPQPRVFRCPAAYPRRPHASIHHSGLATLTHAFWPPPHVAPSSRSASHTPCLHPTSPSVRPGTIIRPATSRLHSKNPSAQKAVVLSILTMERPVSFSAEDICDEKVKVLWSIPPVAREDALLGQYVAANGKLGYLGDDTVPRNSAYLSYSKPERPSMEPRSKSASSSKM